MKEPGTKVSGSFALVHPAHISKDRWLFMSKSVLFRNHFHARRGRSGFGDQFGENEKISLPTASYVIYVYRACILNMTNKSERVCSKMQKIRECSHDTCKIWL